MDLARKPTSGTIERLINMQPTRHYGIFADDPEALKLCDEIEEEIYNHFIEPLQS